MSNLFKPHLELLSLGFRAVISFELRTMLNPEQSQVKLCTMPVDKYVAYSSIITRQTEDNMIRSIALILLRDSPLEYSTLAIQLLVLEHCSRFSHRRGGWVRTRIRLDNRTLPLCSFLDLRSRPVSSKGVLSNGMFFRQEVRQIRRDVFVRTHSKPNIHLSCGKFLPYDWTYRIDECFQSNSTTTSFAILETTNLHQYWVFGNEELHFVVIRDICPYHFYHCTICLERRGSLTQQKQWVCSHVRHCYHLEKAWFHGRVKKVEEGKNVDYRRLVVSRVAGMRRCDRPARTQTFLNRKRKAALIRVSKPPPCLYFLLLTNNHKSIISFLSRNSVQSNKKDGGNNDLRHIIGLMTHYTWLITDVGRWLFPLLFSHSTTTCTCTCTTKLRWMGVLWLLPKLCANQTMDVQCVYHYKNLNAIMAVAVVMMYCKIFMIFLAVRCTNGVCE